jgi:hypothetical protein
LKQILATYIGSGREELNQFWGQGKPGLGTKGRIQANLRITALYGSVHFSFDQRILQNGIF